MVADFSYEAKCAICGICVEIFIDIPEVWKCEHLTPTLNVLCSACQKFMMKIEVEEIAREGTTNGLSFLK